MGIYEDGKIIEENGVKAQLHFSGEESDSSSFEDPIGNLGAIFVMCYKYSDRVISTTDYKAQCLLFSKIYNLYLDEIDANMLAKHKHQVSKKIEELQKELAWDAIIYDIKHETTTVIQAEINKYTKWLEQEKNNLSDYIIGTDSYNKSMAKIQKYTDIINNLELYK